MKCKRNGCKNELSYTQIAQDGKYCSPRCWQIVEREIHANSYHSIARRLGINYNSFCYAVRKGRWDGEKLTTPHKPRPAVGESIAERARSLGISRPTYYRALRSGRITEDGMYIPEKPGRKPRKTDENTY